MVAAQALLARQRQSKAAGALDMGLQAAFLRLGIEKHTDIAKIPALCAIEETAAASQAEHALYGSTTANSLNPLIAHGIGEQRRSRRVDDGQCRSHCPLLVAQGCTDIQKSACNAIGHQPPLCNRRQTGAHLQRVDHRREAVGKCIVKRQRPVIAAGKMREAKMKAADIGWTRFHQ